MHLREGRTQAHLGGEKACVQDVGAFLVKAEVTLSFSLFLSLPTSRLDV